MELSEEEKTIEEYRQNQKEQQNIVFIERQLNLNSALTFLQTIYKTTRLITLIGEIHQKSWTCKQPHISIAHYCLERVSKNRNCRVMLEYNPSADPERIGSEAIRTVYASLNLMAGGRDYIIPFDFRSYFLSSQGQSLLYDYDWRTESIIHSNIESKFIIPYFEKYQSAFALNPQQYDQGIYNYLIGPFLQDVTQTFQAIGGQIQQNYPIDHIQLALKQAWKKVADFFILREILRNDEINEYIVILGNKHFENLRVVLGNMSNEINYQQGTSQNCVKLYHTYAFN